MRLGKTRKKKTSSGRNKDAFFGFFFGDGMDDCKDGNDLRSTESLKLDFTQSPNFPDHVGRISDVRRECIKDRRIDQRTDGQSFI